MSERAHKIYVFTLAAIVIISLVYLAIDGYSYYQTGMEERFYHKDHKQLKPSGSYGHGYGIMGTLMMIIGVGSYMLRKRVRYLARFGRLKHWLEFHIFLCTLGPILVLFHTAFKFGGIVSISFWSMVAVVVSGVLGRFIYLQIPRSIQGQALSLNEVKELKTGLWQALQHTYNLDENSINSLSFALQSVSSDKSNSYDLRSYLTQYVHDWKCVHNIKPLLKKNNLGRKEYKDIIKLIKEELHLNRRIKGLMTMQQLFKYWHVAHLPFALIMLVIMAIHVVITLIFGYKWIF
jgi:hypothetical protein